MGWTTKNSHPFETPIPYAWPNGTRQSATKGTHMRFVDLQILRLLWSRMLENSVGIFWPPVGVGVPNRLHHVAGRNSLKKPLKGWRSWICYPNFFIGRFMHIYIIPGFFFRFETVAKMLGRFSQGIPILGECQPGQSGKNPGRRPKVGKAMAGHTKVSGISPTTTTTKKKNSCKNQEKTEIPFAKEKETSYINWSQKKSFPSTFHLG